MVTTIAVIDDHPILRDGLASLLANSSVFEVVGIGGTAGELLPIVLGKKPEAILVDLQMPGDVLKAIVQVRDSGFATRIIVFTVSDRLDHVISALSAGADGYVLKGSSFEELTFAIKECLVGGTYVTPSLSNKMIQALKSKTEAQAKKMDLSSREQQIIEYLAEGMPNKVIASHLGISEKTVKHYMTGIIQKLEVHNRLEVVIRAQKMGILPKESNFQSTPYQ